MDVLEFLGMKKELLRKIFGGCLKHVWTMSGHIWIKFTLSAFLGDEMDRITWKALHANLHKKLRIIQHVWFKAQQCAPPPVCGGPSFSLLPGRMGWLPNHKDKAQPQRRGADSSRHVAGCPSGCERSQKKGHSFEPHTFAQTDITRVTTPLPQKIHGIEFSVGSGTSKKPVGTCPKEYRSIQLVETHSPSPQNKGSFHHSPGWHH